MSVIPPDPRNILGHVPGRFCVDPTNLSTAYPHGGTPIGEVAEAVVIRDAPVQRLTAEERGNEVYEAIAGGESWSIAAILREWSPEAYATFFLNATDGAISGRPEMPGTSENRAGYRYGDRSGVWVFSPLNADIHPWVIFYRGMPMVQDTAELRVRLGGDADRWAVPIVIVATRDVSDRVYWCGSRQEAAL